VWYVRDGLEQRVISRKVLAGLSRRCDMAVCASRYVASQFRRYVSPLVPTTVVYDIVDLGRFRPEAAAPPDLTKEPGDIWFGIVGAITPLKGQDIFLNAAERVLRHLPNSIFLIAGNNPYVTESGMAYEKSLRSKVENSILRNRVKWLGFRNDTPNVMARLDVLVQPNRGPEGLGRSVLEAMACKVPVIAANQWGPAEVIEDSGSGLLFPPLDMEQLTDHMVALGKSGSLREILGKRGHDWIHRNLIATELAGKFDRILAEAIGRQRQEVMA
jgi:glycosyltransferase involved in cell wall biosynthesis